MKISLKLCLQVFIVIYIFSLITTFRIKESSKSRLKFNLKNTNKNKKLNLNKVNTKFSVRKSLNSNKSNKQELPSLREFVKDLNKNRNKSTISTNNSTVSNNTSGHYEKITKKVAQYFWVEGTKPSGLPGSYVISDREALNNNDYSKKEDELDMI